MTHVDDQKPEYNDQAPITIMSTKISSKIVYNGEYELGSTKRLRTFIGNGRPRGSNLEAGIHLKYDIEQNYERYF